jgi:hypothetical protein
MDFSCETASTEITMGEAGNSRKCLRRVLDWDRRAVVCDQPISSKGTLTGNIVSFPRVGTGPPSRWRFPVSPNAVCATIERG